MNTSIASSTFTASCLVFLATFGFVHQVVALFLIGCRDLEIRWQKHETRWVRLRQQSMVFRLAQRFIIVGASVIESKLTWFIQLPTAKKGLFSIATGVFRVILGDSNRLHRAVQSYITIQPWHSSEVVIAGWILSLLTVVMSWCWLYDETSHVKNAAYSLLLGWACYRGWLYYHVQRGEKRRKAMRAFLPHTMDSIAMVMSAGGTFRAGVDTVIEDFPCHPLSQEFAKLRNELDRGQMMTQALQSVADTICLPEFDELVRVLARIHQHGSPASSDFVRLAKQLRITHLRNMEAAVGRAEAQMALPTMLVMASCMIVASAPFVLSIVGSQWVTGSMQ